MAELSLPNPPEEPRFIEYLLAPNKNHDCFFMVGKRELVEPKKIGAVKIMLMAHSEVLRVELEESEIAEKGVVPVEDLYPDTFINLLKYVYGYDTTSSLSFADADNLLYAAEKYIMEPLKASLSARLMTLLTPDNICQLLNNPACYGTLELKSAITRILQYETDRVLDSRAFLDLDQEGFIKILEQESMNIEEIQVWRAAVKWGKQRGGTEEGRVLSKQLSEPLKHIRVCTISLENFTREVAPKKILDDSSVAMVVLYHGKKEKQVELVQASNETKPRKMNKTNEAKSINKIALAGMDLSTGATRNESSFTLLTKNFGLELLSLQFLANKCSSHLAQGGLTYKCDCTVEITDITNRANNTSTKPPVTVRFSQQVEYGASFQVPLTSNGENIRLLPNTMYKLAVRFTERHRMYYTLYRVASICNEHMTICFEYVGINYYSPVDTLWYRPVGVSIAEHQ